MPRRTIRNSLHLDPRVVRSVVEGGGMDHAAIAQRLKVDRSQVDDWVNTGRIDYSKVKALAKCLRLSENALLTKIPLVIENLPDYRMRRDAPERLDADDLPQVRRARYMQSVAKKMMGARSIAVEPDIPPGVTVAAPADGVARAERTRLAVVGRPDGAISGLSRDIYRILRGAIEDLNIFVFQYPLVTEGVCGLSLADSDPRAILVNSRDIGQAKAFTLLHEYGHILLGMGGVCDEHGAVCPDTGKKRAEAWCNRFAASFLMPEAEFAAERRRLEAELPDNPLGVVNGLAKKFKVSGYAAAVRAAGLPGGKPGATYAGILNGIAGRYSRRKRTEDDEEEDEDTKKGGPHYLDTLVSQMGRKFIRLAVSSYEKKVITGLDLGDYLNIDLKHLDGLCKRVTAPE